MAEGYSAALLAQRGQALILDVPWGIGKHNLPLPTQPLRWHALLAIVDFSSQLPFIAFVIGSLRYRVCGEAINETKRHTCGSGARRRDIAWGQPGKGCSSPADETGIDVIHWQSVSAASNDTPLPAAANGLLLTAWQHFQYGQIQVNPIWTGC